MKNHLIAALITALAASFAVAAQASPSTQLVEAFVAASEKARQPGAQQEDIEKYLAFLADDFSDHHVAYGRSFEGKAHLRRGIKQKAEAMVSISQDIESIVLGSSTAVVVVNEDSRYYKDGKLKHFMGRTILVLEFNDSDLISQMRRYLD